MPIFEKIKSNIASIFSGEIPISDIEKEGTKFLSTFGAKPENSEEAVMFGIKSAQEQDKSSIFTKPASKEFSFAQAGSPLEKIFQSQRRLSESIKETMEPGVEKLFGTPESRMAMVSRASKILNLPEVVMGGIITKTKPNPGETLWEYLDRIPYFGDVIAQRLQEKGIINNPTALRTISLAIGLAIPNLPGGELSKAGKATEFIPGTSKVSKLAGEVPPVSKIPKELEPLAVEARKYKSASEFAEEFSRNNTVNDVRNIVSKFDENVNKLNQKLTGKEIKMVEDIKLGLKAEKTAQMWAGDTRSINKIDRQLFSETKRALSDFYTQATKGIKEVKPINFGGSQIKVLLAGLGLGALAFGGMMASDIYDSEKQIKIEKAIRDKIKEGDFTKNTFDAIGLIQNERTQQELKDLFNEGSVENFQKEYSILKEETKKRFSEPMFK